MKDAHQCDMGAEACGRTVKPNRKIRNVWSVFHVVPEPKAVISNFICPHCWNTNRDFIMKVLSQTAMDAVKIKYQAWGLEKDDIAWPTHKIIDAPMVPLEDLKPKEKTVRTSKGLLKVTPTGNTLKSNKDESENKVPDEMKEAINEEHEVTAETMDALDKAIEEKDAK